MFFWYIVGAIGETSAIALLIGGAYLLIKVIIGGFSYLYVSFLIFIAVFWRKRFDLYFLLAHFLGEAC